jgi:hypothetical protein
VGLQWDSAWGDAFRTGDVDVGSMMIPDLNMRFILLVDYDPIASSTLTPAPRVETDAAVRETNSITYHLR